MTTTRRSFFGTAAALAAAVAAPMFSARARAQSRKLRFGVGPFLPSPEDTRKSYTPFFAYLAKEMGTPEFDLAVTTDWAGLAVAMGSGNLDAAWMGPWGYMLAQQASGCRAIATVKYEEKPTYKAIIIARPEVKATKFPDDTRGLSISFADVGSTSGWLIPHFYAKEVWKIDPRTFWKYTEGASHPANEIAVQAGQVDLATDYDRNRASMIDSGRIKPDSNRVVWESDPLPNDALAVARSMPAEQVAAAQRAMLAITKEMAIDLMPKRYTGWVSATHDSYRLIENAGLALGKLKKA
jgi:phosphonate transport system substrate-binding protein